MTTETAETTETAKPKFIPVDPATLGNGLYSEKVSVDPQGDAFAISPPVPDDWYVALLTPSTDPEHPTLEFVEYPARDGKAALKVFRVNFNYVVESFVDPAKDNGILKGKNKTFDARVTTVVKEKDGFRTSEATTLLKYLGYGTPDGTDIEQIAATLNQLIGSGQCRLAVRTQWVAGWTPGDGKKSYGKWAVQGERNFPVLADGKSHSPVMSIKGAETRAKAKVAEQKPLSAFSGGATK